MVDLASALLSGTRKKKFHELLAQQSMSTAPTPSWGAALARALQGGIAGMMENRERDSDGTEFDRLFGQQASVQPPQPAPLATALSAPQAEPQSGNPGFANAIASIESGGKYDRLGPVTKTGDRAYGKYQVMGANIPQWTKAHLGQEMTPDAFIADPKAQDAVFNGRFGQYAQKYGPEGAAKAWFAGEKGMNNPNARDQLGTTVAAYAQKFNKALGPQAPQQEGELPPGAQLAQGQMPPQMAQPQQTRVAPQIPPHIMGQARKLWQEGDRAAAGALMQPYLTPKDQSRPMTPQERAAYRVPENVPASIDTATNKPSYGPAPTNVTTNVGGGSDKQIFDTMDTRANEARTVAAGLTGLREARSAIQGGAILGAGANQILGLQKVASMLGLGNADKITNTETFRAAIAPQVAAVLKATVGTANISNTDREFAEKAAGGNITLDEKSISRLLDIMERASVGKLNSHQKTLERVYPDAEKYARERALFGVEMPAAIPAPAPAASAPPPGALEEARRRGLIK
jgi:hypothetical protein